MKQTLYALFLSPLFGGVALAHHENAPASELSLASFVAVAVIVGLSALLATFAIRSRN